MKKKKMQECVLIAFHMSFVSFCSFFMLQLFYGVWIFVLFRFRCLSGLTALQQSGTIILLVPEFEHLWLSKEPHNKFTTDVHMPAEIISTSVGNTV